MSDEDVVKFCESDVTDQESELLLAKIMKSAKVERFKRPDGK